MHEILEWDEDGSEKDLRKIIKIFGNICVPQVNEMFESYTFQKQVTSVLKKLV